MPSKHLKVVLVLSACMALQMTSFVIILPLFPRRFAQLGAGVEALGVSAMAYALAATVAAPFMGALADRLGRRRLVLGSLAAYVLAFIGYLFAASVPVFVALRGLAGALTAGLVPAATAIVADLAPIDRRGQWIGILNGGASVGWIAGPILGGALYDRWGYSVALIVSIGMAAATFLLAFRTIPSPARRTFRPADLPQGQEHFRFKDFLSRAHTGGNALPGPFPVFLAILCISFAVMFAWAFMEPKFMFHAYDELRWSSSMLGLVMSTFGIAMLLGEFGLGRLSDRLGRMPVTVLGLVLFSAQFLGLTFSRSYVVIAATFVVAGLGNALFDPALSAFILDITAVQHQARVVGIKTAASSAGNILGPALVVVLAPRLDARAIFLISAAVVALTTLLAVGVSVSAPVRNLALRSTPFNGGAD